MSVKFLLVNTMNKDAKRIISTHKTKHSAEKAQEKFDRSVRKSEGQNNWIPTSIYCSDEVTISGQFVY